MRVPEIKIQPITTAPAVYIRYGVGWAGRWFWEVVTKYGENVIGYAFTTDSGTQFYEWGAYDTFLKTLPEDRQKKVARRVVKQIEDMLIEMEMPYRGVYRFDTTRLFVLIKKC